MKKCSRCGSLLNWKKPYCPLCGGFTMELPDVKPEVPPMEETLERSAVVTSVIETATVIPQSEPIAPPPVAAQETVPFQSGDPVEELAGSGGTDDSAPRSEPETSISSLFERFNIPQELLQTASDETAAMFEKRDGPPAIPTPPPAANAPLGEPATGEFLKMFPDAKPE